MKKFKQTLIDTVEPALNKNKFYRTNETDGWNQPLVYYRKSNEFIEIIEIGKDKYEPCIRVYASIVFLNAPKEKNNINYVFFNEYCGGDINKITTYECKKIYMSKGNFGYDFHFENVYFALGGGIIGVSEKSKKPIGIRIKKKTDATYREVCELIIKRLSKVYAWLEAEKKK